jgi:glutathione synthase/RimK-type ligase-like ATP-grasp enzyme
MIVLWGLASDRPLATVRTALARAGRNAFLLDQRAVLETAIDFAVDDEVRCIVEWGGLRIDFAAVTAAYLRPYDPYGVPEVATTAPDSPERRHAALVYDALRLWGDLSPARIVNRLGAMGSNGSKPYQGELIRAAGFATPITLVTTDPEAARAFCGEHETVIYKSVSGTRSIVARMTASRLAELDAVVACPTQFQAYVPGVDHRVHVVGEDTFVCELTTTADDYRYADRQGGTVSRRQADLPERERERCVALAASLGLAVAGIDLRRTPDGAWYCFEVNPSPAFSWFDSADDRIANRVADLLASAS